jgi:hypothetical protein
MTNKIPSERRGISRRLKTFLVGTIHAIEGDEIAECIVIDLSASGAQIFFEFNDKLPDRIKLKIKSRKLEETCDVVYRKRDTVGLKFEKSDATNRTRLRPSKK